MPTDRATTIAQKVSSSVALPFSMITSVTGRSSVMVVPKLSRATSPR